MKRIIFTLLCVQITYFSFCQNFPNKYFALKQKADSLYEIKDYKSAAITYSLAIRTVGLRASNDDRWEAASAWAMAKYNDSAFSQLDIIANSGNYINFNITTDKDFDSLHNDRRWLPFVERIKQFDLPLLCVHTYHPQSPISMVFTIDPQSTYFKSDGLGDYRDSIDNVSSVSTHAYNLRIGRRKNGEVSRRAFIIDLNSPLPSTGAVSHGLISDNTASFHIFYKLDTTVKPWVVYNFRDMPVGSTVMSPRTEISMHINGEFHVLQIGFWGLGDCNEPDGKARHNGGEGTTQVQVTRNSETDYTLFAPVGSVGHLWNESTTPNNTDMGLFKTGFIIHLHSQH